MRNILSWLSTGRRRYSAMAAAIKVTGAANPLPPALFDLEQSEPSALKAPATHTHEERHMQSMDDLFYALLQDVYAAEKELLKALPELAKKSTNKTLQQAFADDRDETEEHLERLEKVFEAIGKMPEGKICEAMLGIIAESRRVIDEVEDGAVRDAGIVAAAQAAEHYQIARYGTLRAWAELFGEDEIIELLSDTLEEKKHADELLSWIAEGGVNESASQRPQAAQ
jgi:ferritin-like metal-binding protein YciE